ncbi:MAG: putative toxin-antitoxin system toxin component, PIN family [Xanthomonadaceae bacterium]|nr:putative toxin-antitoxin system toxin component, PIN family [Xanthomonadaceae bacterium]
MNGAPRVVFDTNVVLSALLFGGGTTASLREAWQGGACVPLVDTTTAQELMRVLAYPKFGLSADEQQELLSDYLPYTAVVRMPGRLPKVPACRDPFDLSFLHLALVGKARFLVSGDKDLHALHDAFPIPILTSADFQKRLRPCP